MFSHAVFASLVALVLAPSAFAAPAGIPTAWISTTYTSTTPVLGALGIEIHKSCNSIQRRQLETALKDTEEIAIIARDHVLNNGADDALYKKYFGDGVSAEVVGWFDKLLYGDKTGVLLRCDDIDGNCHQDGWAGHWRGSNATMETVICEMSYEVRRPLSQMCAFGYEVASHETNVYFASDLLHRFFHVPAISDNVIDHYSHGEYADCLSFATTNSTFAVRNSDSLQYFALDAYSYDVANPGVGCAGKANEEIVSSSAVSSSSTTISSSTPSAVPTTTTTTTTTEVPTMTTGALRECHTHADGVEHCS